MDNEFAYFADKEIKELLQRIMELETKIFNLRTVAVQLAIDCNWSNNCIKSQIGASDEELKFFRSE